MFIIIEKHQASGSGLENPFANLRNTELFFAGLLK